ncbi:hypothetical protein KUV61_18350 [Nocardioides marinus]|nr:hypothetical protein [Nocardioides marinus]
MMQYLLLNIEVKENTLASIILSDWSPVLLSVGVGAFLINRISHKHQVRQEFNKRKFEIAEDVAAYFQTLRASSRRLKQISDFQRKVHLAKLSSPDAQAERKERYIQTRDEARDGLEAKLKIADLYFSNETTKKMNEFRKWDRRSEKNHYHLNTSDGEWDLWADELVSRMKKELR